MDNPYSERNQKILSARRSGKTLAQIGKEFGIGRERVRQIVLAEERREKYAKEVISFRTRNALLRGSYFLFPDKRFEVQDFYSKDAFANKVEKYRRDELLRIRNLGVGSLSEIEEIIGFILE